MSPEDGYYAEPVPAETPAPGRGNAVLVGVLVTVLVLVLCGGGVAALYLLGAKDHPSAASGPTGYPASRAAATATPSASATTTDPNTILRGQCVVNDGSDDAPVLRVVGCARGTYQVLARFDGTTDKAKCKAIPGSNFNYFYDTSPDTLDFILCLKKL